MADLMTDTYTYSNLANKYGNFRLPAVKIWIGGTDVLSTMHLSLEEIDIVLSLASAGSARFKLGGIYDKKSRSFRSGVTDKFKPGTIVEIGLGYYSSTIKILKGFVFMLGAEFTDKEMLVVTVMDVRRLMMIGGSRHVLHNVKNYSDIFKNIMSAYTRLCSASVTATNDQLESPVSQVGNDYDFIMEELVGKSDREFIVLGDKAYFRERPKAGAPLMQVELGRELLELSMDYSYLDMKVEVIGYNSYEQTTYTGKAGAKTGEPQTTLISPAPAYVVTDPDAINQEQAAKRAGVIANNEIRRSKNGRLVTVGLPEIVPGRYIEVVKVEKMVNKKYYITQVRHQLTQRFFTTEIETGGWI